MWPTVAESLGKKEILEDWLSHFSVFFFFIILSRHVDCPFSQSRHDVGHIVQYRLQRLWPGSIQFLDQPGETQERSHGAQHRVQQDGQRARHRDLTVVVGQTVADHGQRLAQQLQVGGDVDRIGLRHFAVWNLAIRYIFLFYFLFSTIWKQAGCVMGKTLFKRQCANITYCNFYYRFLSDWLLWTVIDIYYIIYNYNSREREKSDRRYNLLLTL